MNKRQAKIEALEIANGILIASTTTLETDHNAKEYYKNSEKTGTHRCFADKPRPAVAAV